MPTYAEMVDPLKPKIPNVPAPAPMSTPEVNVPTADVAPEPPVESPMSKLEKLNLTDILDFLKAKGVVPKDYEPMTPVSSEPMSSEPTFDDMIANPPVSVTGGI